MVSEDEIDGDSGYGSGLSPPAPPTVTTVSFQFSLYSLVLGHSTVSGFPPKYSDNQWVDHRG